MQNKIYVAVDTYILNGRRRECSYINIYRGPLRSSRYHSQFSGGCMLEG